MIVRPPPDALTLRAGALGAELWPSLGGRVAALASDDGRAWLEPIPGDLPLDRALISGGSYPMAPYCGRIEHGRFSFQDRAIVLPPHPISAPHSLHGVAWDSAFSGEQLSDGVATMRLDHPGGGGWPWPFRLMQTATLTAKALRLDMVIENTCGEDQPAGLGFHPFFQRRDGVRLTFQAQTWWRMGANYVPVTTEPVAERMDFSTARPVVEGFDDVVGGFGGGAQIAWPDGSLEMSASTNMTDATLFSPIERPFFCFEPISHAPNAHNRCGMPGLAILKPGEQLAVTMTLKPLL